MSCPGVRWEIETARTLLHDTLLWMGDWKRVFAEIPARLQEADERGDLYSATHVAVRLAPIALLAADRPERARAEAIAGMARWPSAHFDLQHRFEVCSLIEADLYEGRAADAWTRLRAAWPRLRWIRYAFQNARIEMHFYRARIALARASTGDLRICVLRNGTPRASNANAPRGRPRWPRLFAAVSAPRPGTETQRSMGCWPPNARCAMAQWRTMPPPRSTGAASSLGVTRGVRRSPPPPSGSRIRRS